MVIPPSPPPVRPQWARGGSWRKYIRVSNRKLQTENIAATIAERRCVKVTETANATHELPAISPSEHDLLWYQVRISLLVDVLQLAN